MPELPEVETVCRGLALHMEGRRVARLQLNRPNLRVPLPAGLRGKLEGRLVERVARRAKYILVHVEGGGVLLAHLGMAGRMVVTPAGAAAPPPERHDHVVFETEAGARVTYYDPRRFGYMALVNTATLHLHPWFAGLGPEPLSDDFDADHLKAAFAGRKQGPKTLLLDQRIVAGLGNIYVCEALNRARISPFKAAGKITKPRLVKLVADIRAVLTEAIAAGGSTLRDYAQADGALGYFQHRFRVYGREGEPCLNDPCAGVIARKVQAGRSTFHCPVCQT